MTKEIWKQLHHFGCEDPRREKIQVLSGAVWRVPEQVGESEVIEEGEVEKGGNIYSIYTPGIVAICQYCDHVSCSRG